MGVKAQPLLLLCCSVAATLVVVHHLETTQPAQHPEQPLDDIWPFPAIDGDWRWGVHLAPVAAAAAVLPSLRPAQLETMARTLAAVFALRCVTVLSTRVPPPRKDCTPYSIGWLQLGGCHDMMFSGHAAVLTVLACYADGTARRALAIGAAVVGIGLMMATRHHYTADIVVGGAVGGLAVYVLK